VHSNDWNDCRVVAVCVGYMIQECDMSFQRALGAVYDGQLHAFIHRSFFRQLLLMSEKLLGPTKPRKNSKKYLKDGNWGERWEPKKTPWGEGSEGFVGVEIPTEDNLGYFKIKVARRLRGLGQQSTAGLQAVHL